THSLQPFPTRRSSDLKGCDMLAAVTAGNKRPIGAQSDNHAPDAASHQILCADPGILVRLDRRSSDGFGFALVGNEIVEVFESSRSEEHTSELQSPYDL